jgi:hypothetical protein
MAFSLVNSVAGGVGANGNTSSAIDTTSADLLVLCDYKYDTPAITVLDSKGNDWTPLTDYVAATTYHGRIYYAKNATVGSGHTFTVSGTGNYPGFVVLAFSGSDLTAPFDQENGAVSSSATSLATGSVTPSADNALLVALLGFDPDATSFGIDSSFTLGPLRARVGGSVIGCQSAYKIQTSAGAESPTFSWSGSVAAAAVIATFKAAAGGGGSAVGAAALHYYREHVMKGSAV